jgi:hypothetical protein
MVDSRAKGARVETQIRDVLRKCTGLGWERVPGSGALDPKHKLKGDLYVPEKSNIYCVEAKGYADDHISSAMLTGKTPQIVSFWEQAVRQGIQVDKEPLLVFKFDRSKIFVAFKEMPNSDEYRWFYYNSEHGCFYIALLEEWIAHESPKFIT